MKNNIENPRNTVLITGFQAENTLGRKIVEKRPEVNIFGEPYHLRAEVVQLSELSGHADQHELLEWMKPMMSTVKKGFPGARRAEGAGAIGCVDPATSTR